jgi:hypothetical protein
MTEAEWLAATEPWRMLWEEGEYAWRVPEFLRGAATDRRLRLLAVACATPVWGERGG